MYLHNHTPIITIIIIQSLLTHTPEVSVATDGTLVIHMFHGHNHTPRVDAKDDDIYPDT